MMPKAPMALIFVFLLGLGSLVRSTGAVATLDVASPEVDSKWVNTTDIFSLDPAVNELYLKQRPLSVAAHEVLSAISATDREHGGYAGIVLGDAAVELWWKGEVPSYLQAAIEVVRKAVAVEIMTAAFSRAELEEAAAPIREFTKDPANAFHTVGLPFDGSKVIVKADLPDFALPVDRAEFMPRSLRLPANKVPVVVEHAPPPVAAQRYKDAPPWEGGIAICRYSSDGKSTSRCTAGFPVTNDRGESFLLTAAHCGDAGVAFYTCDAQHNFGQFIGWSSYRWKERDMMLIRADGMWGAIWDGSTGDGFMKKIEYWSDVFGGEWVCQSGTSSGAVCGIKIEETGVSYYLGGNLNSWTYNMVYGRKYDGDAIHSGDSGGPVFVPLGNGKVVAKGINSASAQNDETRMYFGKFFEVNQGWKLNVYTA